MVCVGRFSNSWPNGAHRNEMSSLRYSGLLVAIRTAGVTLSRETQLAER